MKERREPPCPPLKLHSSAGLKWLVCVCEKNLFICHVPTLRQQVGPLFVPSFACQPATIPPHPPSIFVLILQSLFAPLCISFGFSWQNEGRTDAADADGPPKHESARGVPAAARFGNEFGPLDVAFPSLSRFPCVNIAALMILGAAIYHVNFWTS